MPSDHLWFQIQLDVAVFFDFSPELEATRVSDSQSWRQQVFRALILQNESRFQQLHLLWVRCKELCALQRHANLWISACLRLKSPSRRALRLSIRWHHCRCSDMTVNHLIEHFVQHIASCLSAVDLNICEQLRTQKTSVWESVKQPPLWWPYQRCSPRLKPVQIKSWSDLFLFSTYL